MLTLLAIDRRSRLQACRFAICFHPIFFFADYALVQWISVGSGIEHAEGGGTPAGQTMSGFQIWINVPTDRKMDDPRYGTVDPSALPILSAPGVSARLLAGSTGGKRGPFETVQELQMLVRGVSHPNIYTFKHTPSTSHAHAHTHAHAHARASTGPVRRMQLQQFSDNRNRGFPRMGVMPAAAAAAAAEAGFHARPRRGLRAPGAGGPGQLPRLRLQRRRRCRRPAARSPRRLPPRRHGLYDPWPRPRCFSPILNAKNRFLPIFSEYDRQSSPF
jgi:hypothetical protein